MSAHAPVQTEPLEHTLEALAQEHETLIELAKQHRQALRMADSPAIVRIAELRNQTNQRIIALDQERAKIVSEISKSFGLPSANVTVRALISQIGGPSAKRLSGLAGHLGGMLAQVVQSCSVAKTYNARGKMSPGIAVPASMDLRH